MLWSSEDCVVENARFVKESVPATKLIVRTILPHYSLILFLHASPLAHLPTNNRAGACRGDAGDAADGVARWGGQQWPPCTTGAHVPASAGGLR